MSRNLCLWAKRAITVNATGKQNTQTIEFELLQTPTEVTDKILEAYSPFAEYVQWVLDHNFPFGSEHIRNLLQWSADALVQGYVLEWGAS